MRTSPWRVSLLPGALALLGACAGGQPPPGVTPENLPALEAEAARSPEDAGLMARLGIAYYNDKQYARARDVLLSSLALRRPNYAARVYLGLSYEELGQFDSARVAYTAAASEARQEAQRRAIRNRLELLTRKELQFAARAAVAREAELSARPPEPNLVAVFPFQFLGPTDSLRPLARGLTHLMVTDLGKLGQLRLLERERVQALADELKLAEAGRTDPATGARGGRLLRAGRVVQGALQEVAASGNLRMDAEIVDATDATIKASGTGTNRLQQFFALEKAVLFQLLDRLGIPLTPAERRALTERPTADLQAFLAFSRGLEAEDRGDFEAAAANYQAALVRDPNFRAARDKSASVSQTQAALATPATALAGITLEGRGIPETGRGETAPILRPSYTAVLRQGITTTVPSIGSGLTNRVGIGRTPGPITVPPASRPPLPEAFGGDNPTDPGLLGTIIIIIVRP